MARQGIYLSKWSMLLGNLFEHYDTALFSLLSPFIAPLFFPQQDPLTALILTYGIIPLGMIARPIGSLVFGYIGDTRGRKEALMLSLIGMALITICMGLMPTYQQVGYLAPILLSSARMLQNFFAAGEIAGGAIYLIENTPDSHHDIMSSLYSVSTVAGIILASCGLSILCLLNGVQDYWRWLYFFGCLTAIFACFIRLRVNFKPMTPYHLLKSPFKSAIQVCWEMRRTLVTIAVASGFSYACYMVALVMLNGFIPLISEITKDQMMHLNTLLLILDCLLLPVFGLLAQRFSREKMMILAGVVATLAGFPLFGYLQGTSLLMVIMVRLCLVIIGVWFSAPFYSWSQQLTPPAHRYTIISLAYALGSQLLGGPTATISLWLFQKTQWTTSIAWYWMFLGLLTSFLIAKQKTLMLKSGELSKQEAFARI